MVWLAFDPRTAQEVMLTLPRVQPTPAPGDSVPPLPMPPAPNGTQASPQQTGMMVPPNPGDLVQAKGTETQPKKKEKKPWWLWRPFRKEA